MKKKTAAVMLTLCSAFCVILLSACVSRPARSMPPTNLPPQKMLVHLMKELPFTKKLIALNQAAACEYYGIPPRNVREAAAAVGPNGTPENVAVWKARDNRAAAYIAQRTSVFYNAQRDQMDGAEAPRMLRLKDAVIVQKGDYVICCVCQNNTKAQREAYFLLR